MDVKQAIQKRKSIRQYKDKEVSDDLIKELIDAAWLAPSGNNLQPCRFFIIKDKEVKNKLRENKIFYQDFVYTASIIIVCCGDPSVYVKYKGFDNENQTRAIRDVSIASGFLVLRATELELGTCYVGWIDKEKIKDVLNIPKDYVIPYIITVGYSDEEPEHRQRKDLSEIIID